MLSSSLRSTLPRTISRSYATSSSSSIRPPLQLNGLPGKYASSAYVAALSKDSKTLEKLEKDLDQLSQALDSKNKDSAKLKAFIENPTLTVKERTSGLDGLFSGKPDPITRNLFQVLAENGRLGDTEKVIEGFKQLMSAHRGEVEVTVTTAAPIDSSLQKRLETALKNSQIASSRGGKTIKIQQKINPSLQGGLKIDFGDKTVDLSVSSRVGQLNSLLKQGI